MNRPNIEVIYQRIKADMEAAVTGEVKIPRVSLLGILATVFAGSIHLLYGFLEWLSEQLFVDTASGVGLLRWGNILGLPQKAATYPTGYIDFTGTAATAIPRDTVVTSSEGYEYETQAAYVIGTSSPVETVSKIAGKDYNTTDTTLSLSSPIAGVDSDAPVVSGFDDGTDVESTQAWVNRLLQRFQNPPSSGNVEDYVRWALTVDGVGRAWCFEASDWKGTGTCGVAVSAADLSTLSAAIVSNVETYVEGVRPVGVAVDYYSPDVNKITFSVKISPNVTAMQTAISKQLNDLFLLESEPGGTMLLSHFNAAIALAGPDDFEITNIRKDGVSAGVGNITVDTTKVAAFDGATYTSI
jgi:uncharacterized phage protein gp47/JayE